MQLLKVEETFRAELGIDFVLVVDTEGLRAPELSHKSQNHDNELATFVIGLGSLTFQIESTLILILKSYSCPRKSLHNRMLYTFW